MAGVDAALTNIGYLQLAVTDKPVEVLLAQFGLKMWEPYRHLRRTDL